MTDVNVTPDNPAGRLYLLLETAREISGVTKASDGLAKLFNVPVDDFGGIHRGLGLIDASLNEIAELLKLTGGEQFYSLYSTHLPTLRHLLRPERLNLSWPEYLKTIVDRDLTSLQFCSAHLSKHFAEDLVNEDELSELLAEANELYEDVWSANLEENLKKIVLDNLQNIKQAIHDYKIRGVDGLKQALASVLGSAVISEPSTKDNNSLAKLGKIAGHLAAIINLAHLAHPLLLRGVGYIPQIEKLLNK